MKQDAPEIQTQLRVVPLENVLDFAEFLSKVSYGQVTQRPYEGPPVDRF